MSLRIARPGLVTSASALLLGTLLGAASTAVTEHDAAAQPTTSPSDISAARALFASGVKLQEAGKPAEALELFRRADRVYAAPTIQLHLAECQAAVGQLVESAETYRRLNNAVLPADASGPFRAAQTQGQVELPQVELRIPQLRVDVLPANTDGLEVQVDGVPLNGALIGVSRPLNPGEHKIVATAPGFSAAEASITLPERKKDAAVTLTLGAAGGRQASGGYMNFSRNGAVPPPPPPIEGQRRLHRQRSPGGQPLRLHPRRAWRGVNILAGSLDGPTAISKNVGVGGSVALEGGIRLRKLYIGATLEYAGYLGGDLDSSQFPSGDGVSQSTHSEYFGLDLGYMSNPLGTAGFYGEIGAGYRLLSYSASDQDSRVADTFEFGGAEGQVGLGATVRIGKSLLLIPKVDLNVGTFSVNSSSCSDTFGCRTLAQTTDANPLHEAVVIALGIYWDKDY